MILADKIIQLRKKNGWSQEELAEKLGVSRQAVSKWEGAQATPDLSKLLAMSQVFGVTTDYLLRDDMEEEQYDPADSASALRKVTLEEASAYLSWREKASRYIAGGEMLCVLGVIVLLLLGVKGEDSGNTALTGLGLGALLALTAAAVLLFVYCGHRNRPYAFLENEEFETEYGVEGLVEKKRRETRKARGILLGAGIALCILSPIPVLVGAFLTLTDLQSALLVCLTIFLAGGGAGLCILSGVRRSSMDQLLQQGDYSAQGKQRRSRTGPISAAYWLIVTAVFLAWSILGDRWNISWVVWPIAGVLYAALMALLGAFSGKEKA